MESLKLGHKMRTVIGNVKSPQRQARDYLVDLLDDYRNNYLSVALFAEHNGLDTQEAVELLQLARVVASHKHPEE